MKATFFMQRPITGLRYKSVAALLACGCNGKCQHMVKEADMAELKYNDENFDDDFDDFDDYDDRFHQQMKLTMVLLPYIHRKIWKMLLKL